jgi:hypothetical protein
MYIIFLWNWPKLMEPKKEGQSEFFSWHKKLIQKKEKFLLVFSIKKKPKSTLLSLSLSLSLSFFLSLS